MCVHFVQCLSNMRSIEFNFNWNFQREYRAQMEMESKSDLVKHFLLCKKKSSIIIHICMQKLKSAECGVRSAEHYIFTLVTHLYKCDTIRNTQ